METPPVDARAVRIFPNADALLQGPPELASDARAMGFRLMSLANNHATDLGPDAAINTRELFKAAGIAVAGSGATLEAARAPAFASTAKGKVALVATASTFKAFSMAQDAITDLPARPGISVVHVNKISIVTAAEMTALRAIAARQSHGRFRPPAANATQLSLNGATYRVGSKSGVTYEMNEYDRYAILKAVHEARGAAELVVFSIHAHESATGVDDDNPEPADFLIQLFHEVVDAGADVVVGGGPHGNRGIEIYKGKPIFYGMGVFTMNGKAYFSQEVLLDRTAMLEAMGQGAAELGESIGHPRSWLESMIAVSDFADGRLARIRIFPLDLSGKQNPRRRGYPIVATGAEAQRLLDLLQRDSAQFGTKIERDGSIGIINVISASPK